MQRTAWSVAAAAALLVTAYVAVSAWSLSVDQIAERDLGRFDVLYGSVAEIKPGPNKIVIQSLTAAGTAQGGMAVVVDSFDVKPEALDTRFVRYTEGPWAQHPFPGLELRYGRWPTEPGEVAVTSEVGLREGTLPVLSGRARFTIVGVVDDRYSADPRLIAAPGTWSKIPASAAQAREGLSANVSLLADTEHRREAANLVTTINAEVVAPIDRAELRPERSWLDRSPFAFFIPSLLVPALVAATAVRSGRRHYRRFSAAARDLGMPPAAVRRSLAAATAVFLAGGAVIGVTVGALVGAGARLLTRPLSGQAIGPFPNLLPALAVILFGSLAGGLTALLIDLHAPRRELAAAMPGAGEEKPRLKAARRWVGLLAGCAAVFAYFRITSATSAMVFAAALTVCCLSLVPDILHAVARVLPERRPDTRLARRWLTTPNRFAPATGTILLTALLALPLTTAVLLGATGSTERNTLLAQVGPGQVGLFGRGGLAAPADPAVANRVMSETAVSSTNRVQVYVVDAWYDVWQGNALVVAVDSDTDAARLLGAPLDAHQQQVLRGGGMLVWQPGSTLLADDTPLDPQPESAGYTPAQEWQAQTGAVMLRSTARHLGLASQRGGVVLAGVTPQDSERAREAVYAAGLDPQAVKLYHPPASPLPPLPLVVSALTLFALLLGAAFVTNHTQARSIRDQLARIVAIGASPRFAGRAYLLSQMLTTSLALCLAAGLAVAPALALVRAAPGVQLNAPTTIILVALAAFVSSMALSIATGLGTMRASADRGNS